MTQSESSSPRAGTDAAATAGISLVAHEKVNKKAGGLRNSAQIRSSVSEPAINCICDRFLSTLGKDGDIQLDEYWVNVLINAERMSKPLQQRLHRVNTYTADVFFQVCNALGQVSKEWSHHMPMQSCNVAKKAHEARPSFLRHWDWDLINAYESFPVTSSTFKIRIVLEAFLVLVLDRLIPFSLQHHLQKVGAYKRTFEFILTYAALRLDHFPLNETLFLSPQLRFKALTRHLLYQNITHPTPNKDVARTTKLMEMCLNKFLIEDIRAQKACLKDLSACLNCLKVMQCQGIREAWLWAQWLHQYLTKDLRSLQQTLKKSSQTLELYSQIRRAVRDIRDCMEKFQAQCIQVIYMRSHHLSLSPSTTPLLATDFVLHLVKKWKADIFKTSFFSFFLRWLLLKILSTRVSEKETSQISDAMTGLLAHLHSAPSLYEVIEKLEFARLCINDHLTYVTNAAVQNTRSDLLSHSERLFAAPDQLLQTAIANLKPSLLQTRESCQSVNRVKRERDEYVRNAWFFDNHVIAEDCLSTHVVRHAQCKVGKRLRKRLDHADTRRECTSRTSCHVPAVQFTTTVPHGSFVIGRGLSSVETTKLKCFEFQVSRKSRKQQNRSQAEDASSTVHIGVMARARHSLEDPVDQETATKLLQSAICDYRIVIGPTSPKGRLRVANHEPSRDGETPCKEGIDPSKILQSSGDIRNSELQKLKPMSDNRKLRLQRWREADGKIQEAKKQQIDPSHAAISLEQLSGCFSSSGNAKCQTLRFQTADTVHWQMVIDRLSSRISFIDKITQSIRNVVYLLRPEQLQGDKVFLPFLFFDSLSKIKVFKESTYLHHYHLENSKQRSPYHDRDIYEQLFLKTASLHSSNDESAMPLRRKDPRSLSRDSSPQGILTLYKNFFCPKHLIPGFPRRSSSQRSLMIVTQLP